jgi:hypothetical protein
MTDLRALLFKTLALLETIAAQAGTTKKSRRASVFQIKIKKRYKKQHCFFFNLHYFLDSRVNLRLYSSRFEPASWNSSEALLQPRGLLFNERKSFDPN